MRYIFIKIHKKFVFSIISIILILIIILAFAIKNEIMAVSVSKDQLVEDLRQMFLLRDKAALEQNTETIKYMFDTNTNLGRWAYEHEKNRMTYLKNWAIITKVKFNSMESDIKIQRIREKNGSIWVDFLHSGKFTYAYTDMPDQPVSFGIGTRRTIEITKKDDKWIIKREWYLDPFENELELPDELKNEENQSQNIQAPAIAANDDLFIMDVAEPAATKNKPRYDREKAVAYADKYCGATFGSGNNYKYNKKYRDFTGLGGDCSNFTSQVLGDSQEGGGLKMDGSWFYNYTYKGIGGGTQAWVRASILKDYLLYSGKANLVKRGTYDQITEPSSQYPEGAYKKLFKGDLVAYEDKGKVDHFSTITAFDPKGLPLVNSHTTDRYHVPWNLGWAGKNIKYWLLHIRD